MSMSKFKCFLSMVSVIFMICVAMNAGKSMAQEALSVRVLSFNLRYNNPGDGPNRWERRRERVVELIARSSADFVGAQEALPDQVAYLREKLPAYAILARSREADPARGEAAPVLYRRDRWELDPKQHGTFWLSDTPEVAGSITWDNACTRIVTWGRFLEKRSGRAIYGFNTHFDHRGRAPREKSAVLLAERIARRVGSDPVLLTGDFNAGEKSMPIRYLQGKVPGSPVELLETFRAVHPDAKGVGTFNGFQQAATGPKIDYIFVSPDAKVTSASILRNQHDGRYPSDHFPVFAEVVFPRK